jgi:hypothetical protein
MESIFSEQGRRHRVGHGHKHRLGIGNFLETALHEHYAPDLPSFSPLCKNRQNEQRGKSGANVRVISFRAQPISGK